MPAPSDARRATPADHDRVVTTVVEAFHRDPAFRWFFNADGFGEQAAAFAGALFDRRVAREAVWVVDGGAAVAMWEPPGADWTDHGALDALPVGVRRRLVAWDEAIAPLLPTGDLWYLGVLATSPSRVGEGLGRRAAAPGLAAAAAAGLDAWLETSSAANVAMYRRRGWELVGAVEVAGVTASVLRRPAAG